MKDNDPRARCRFIKSLGPKGDIAPAYLPPGQQPRAPYFRFVLPLPGLRKTVFISMMSSTSFRSAEFAGSEATHLPGISGREICGGMLQ